MDKDFPLQTAHENNTVKNEMQWNNKSDETTKFKVSNIAHAEMV